MWYNVNTIQWIKFTRKWAISSWIIINKDFIQILCWLDYKSLNQNKNYVGLAKSFHNFNITQINPHAT